jgi:hypothetical protein
MRQSKSPQPIETLKTKVAPVEIAVSYLQHEFHKLFSGQKSEFYAKVDNLISSFPATLGEKHFWYLVSGISEAYKFKWVHRTLTNTQFCWSLEKVRLDDVTMTGMSPYMDKVLKQAQWTPSKFARIWKRGRRYTKAKEAEGIRPYSQRDYFPILLRESDRQLKVFDGMRRTCVAALQEKADVIAWVGRICRSKGFSLINPDKVLALRVLYDNSPTKDQKLLKAIQVIMRRYLKQYRNGEEVVKNVLSEWEEDPNLAKVVKDILKSSPRR